MKIKEKVQAYLEYCEFRKELDSKTLKAYRIDIRQYFEFIESDDPVKEEIEKYITDLHKKFKQKTVKRKLASVKAFYNYLEEEEIIADSPFRKIKVKFKENVQLPRIIPKNEIEQLLNFMYRHMDADNEKRRGQKLRDVAVVEVFFATGARVYEISNLRWDCINLESGLMRIMGKGGKERYIQIGDQDIIYLLKEYYKENEAAIKKQGYFFVNKRGSRFTEQSIRAMVKKYTCLAGIERHITPHMFRHSFATYLIEEGVDVSCVQQILGHSSIKTTQIYIHIAVAVQTKILKEFHPRKKMRIIGLAA
ncbi:MAG: tyrosine-type recombinase/integrase [Hespellia sp.]|nr:tyrosine-type recombinase/integrase [Hespellia sp.]